MVCKPTTLAAKYGSTALQGTQGSVNPNRPIMLNSQSNIFKDSILSFADIINTQQNPVDGYDRTTLIRITNGLNTSLRRVDLKEYPTLQNRIRQGNIIYPEVGDFLNQSSFDINQVDTGISTFTASLPVITSANNVIVSDDFVSTDVEKILDQLDFYYSENAANNISGGFCSAFSNPFGQILGIVSAIQVGQDLLSKLLSFDFSFGLTDLLSPLNTIKDMLLNVVDTLKDTLLAQVDGIISSVTGIVGQLKDFAANAQEFFHGKIQAVKNFFKDFSLDTIKESMESLIEDAKAQFEELTPEALALLMFRFCQFSEMIQSFMKAPVDALKGLVDGFTASSAIQLSRGLQSTSRAVAAGGTRFDEEARARLRREAASRSSPNRDNPIEPRDRALDGEYYASVEELTPEEINTLTNLTAEGYPGKFIFSPSVINMGKTVSDASDDAGFTEVKPRVWVGLLKVVNRLQRMGELSGPLTINSAYRSPEYNRRIGGAKKSQHRTGLALDVSMRGLGGNEFERQFIRVASQEGFKAIGVYNTFIHIDMRDERNYWPQGTRHQSWLVHHFYDRFRNGAPSPESTDDTVVASTETSSEQSDGSDNSSLLDPR